MEARKTEEIGDEKLDWIVISRATCVTDSSVIQSGTTSEIFDEKNNLIRFHRAFPSAPALFVTVSSMNGTDPVLPRIRDVRSYDAWIGLQEDTTKDEEIKHAQKESIHWWAISPGLINTAQTDSDADGMPDAYENLLFGTRDALPDADADEDGISNLEEMRLGLNPQRFNPAPLLYAWDLPVTQSARNASSRNGSIIKMAMKPGTPISAPSVSVLAASNALNAFTTATSR